MNFEKITYPDINNGVGCRVSLWVSGCTHHCPYCQNKHTWDFKSGYKFDENTLEYLNEILNKPYIKGLTLTGGDPLDSFEDVLDIVKKVKYNFPQKDIWLYTGYDFDTIKDCNEMCEILDFIDYVVDGVFVFRKRDVSLKFRGSSNQTIWEKDENNNWAKSKMNE